MKKVSLFLLFLSMITANAEEGYFDYSLEQLMNVQVSSVTANELQLKHTPAATYVITAEDIKASGFQSLPELFRTVPGLQVSQINSNIWSVSSRGFSTRYTDKLLVMIDGRSVYSTLFSGVFWEVQDLVLDDIEKIEVVRGPGSTLWGANAVNGVINIITKKAQDTQGTYLKFGGGNYHQGFAALRYGDNIDEDVFYRLSLKHKNLDRTKTRAGVDRADDWDLSLANFRLDWQISEETELSFTSDFSYSDRVGTDILVFDETPIALPAAFASPAVATAADQFVRNYNFLIHLKHRISDDHKMAFRTYFDSVERTNPIGDEIRQTYDFDFKDYWVLDERNQFVWGLGYRSVRDKIDNKTTFVFSPEDTTFATLSSLLEYTFHFIPDELVLTLGSKFEENDYTGFEVQPNARLRYHLSEKTMLWTSFSRAVRVPSRFEKTSVLKTTQLLNPLFLPAHSAVEQRGNTALDAEILHAYELGFRSQIRPDLNVDIALFYNDYSELIVSNLDSSTVLDPLTPIVFNAGNDASADTYGVELSSNWQATEKWRLGASYTFFKSDEDGTEDLDVLEGTAPKNAVNLHSHYQLLEELSFHTHAYYKDNIVGNNIKKNIRLDAGLIWELKKDWEFSVWLQNALDPQGFEAVDTALGTGVSEIERSLYAQLTAKF